jgi:hypothetical protein
MRNLSTDRVQGEHMSWMSIYRCEKEKVRQKRINKDLVSCWRHYGKNKIISCGCLQLD